MWKSPKKDWRFEAARERENDQANREEFGAAS